MLKITDLYMPGMGNPQAPSSRPNFSIASTVIEIQGQPYLLLLK